MIFFVILLVLVFIAQIAELFIPPLPWLFNAHVYIAPVVVFYGAVVLPFPLMLALALYAGILLDVLTVQVLGSRVEISMGSSILIYGVLAGIMHGLKPLYARGRWEIHCIMCGVCTSAIVLAQYLMITFRRGSFLFTQEVWWQIGGPGLIAVLISPLVFWILHWVARATRYSYLPGRSAVDYE
jgi:hypothetical protein